MLNNSTIEALDQYWSTCLRCPCEALHKDHRLVLPDPESRFHHIYCFLRNQSVIIAISTDYIDVFREQAANWTQADIVDEQRLRGLIGGFFGRIIGPAFIGYADGATFRPTTGKAVRFLESNDGAALEALRVACSALEWEHGGSRLEGIPVAGAFADGQLVAVASYKSWGSLIAHISVHCSPLVSGTRIRKSSRE